MAPAGSRAASRGCVPVGCPIPGDGDLQVLALLYLNHLGGRLKPELLHHGFEVILTRTLPRDTHG